jgi:hypothetical protein
MTSIPKVLMTLGAIIFVVGFLLQFIHIGRLPGDIMVKKGNTTVYFPIVFAQHGRTLTGESPKYDLVAVST